MDKSSAFNDLLNTHRLERKELQAKTQKMKHAVSKGDKKKKDIASEIAQLMSDLDLKHQNELQEFEARNSLHALESIEIFSVHRNTLQNQNTDEVLPTEEDSKTSLTSNGLPSSCVQKISKAQKRRNKKAQQNREREEDIAQQEITNLSGNRFLETVEITKKLSERGLAIHEIPSDGHCLYKAIEHQLSTLNLEGRNLETLRKSTSYYLLSHKDEFSPFLTDPNTGDILNEEQYIKYCDDIRNTSAWGGHVEIQALASICGKPIEIIQAVGPSIIVGDETTTPRLMITYHRHAYGLGEHYNSVVKAC